MGRRMVLVVCVLIALTVAWIADQRMRVRMGKVESDAKSAASIATYVGETLAVELALRLADERQEGARARRVVARARRLADQVELPDDTRGALQLGCALPASLVEDRRLALPAAAREVLRWRRVIEEEGVRGEPAGLLPPHVQIGVVAWWFETNAGRGAAALRDDLLTGRVPGLSPQMIQAALARMDDLIDPEEDDAMSGLPGMGIVLCVRPDLPPGGDSVLLNAALRATEVRLRARLRPGDRVYVADCDVIAWLPTAREKDARALVTRLSPGLTSVSVLNVRVRCLLGAAVAGVDAQRMPDLVTTARMRTTELDARVA